MSHARQLQLAHLQVRLSNINHWQDVLCQWFTLQAVHFCELEQGGLVLIMNAVKAQLYLQL